MRPIIIVYFVHLPLFSGVFVLFAFNLSIDNGFMTLYVLVDSVVDVFFLFSLASTNAWNGTTAYR